jgi:hypothetical protein
MIERSNTTNPQSKIQNFPLPIIPTSSYALGNLSTFSPSQLPNFFFFSTFRIRAAA